MSSAASRRPAARWTRTAREHPLATPPRRCRPRGARRPRSAGCRDPAAALRSAAAAVSAGRAAATCCAGSASCAAPCGLGSVSEHDPRRGGSGRRSLGGAARRARGGRRRRARRASDQPGEQAPSRGGRRFERDRLLRRPRLPRERDPPRRGRGRAARSPPRRRSACRAPRERRPGHAASPRRPERCGAPGRTPRPPRASGPAGGGPCPARERQRPLRHEPRGLAVGVECLVEPAGDGREMAAPKRRLVLLEEGLAHEGEPTASADRAATAGGTARTSASCTGAPCGRA